jgi:hypothetical protein
MKKTGCKTEFIVVLLIISLALFSCRSDKKESTTEKENFVQISRENPSYFQLSDGTPYIPVGINLISPSGKYRNNPDSSLYDFGQWMKKLSSNGGNYIRVWLSSPFWDIEDQKAGLYSEEKAGRIDTLIKMAERYNLRIKMTLEHFRSLTEEENPQPWAVKSVYHTSNGGPLDSIRQYISSQEGQKLFIDKAGFYSSRYGSRAVFFGWELWNEMNAMKGPEDSLFFMWNERMLKEVKKSFPDNLVMQSLGSFDTDGVRSLYRKMTLLPDNEVAQVHRYLDPGAPLDLCQMPMDIICSSAVEDIISYNPGKPVILAETGAVESRHSGPSRFYSVDTAGILLHDILFAPFFSGSAGAGMSWHWDSYVDKNNLWYHFGRFSEAVKNIDPVKEKFIVSKHEAEGLRIYRLSGRKTVLLWLRDKSNTWETELRDHQPPRIISGIRLDNGLTGLSSPAEKIEIYDPWKNIWSDAEAGESGIALPGFRRSIVIRIVR